MGWSQHGLVTKIISPRHRKWPKLGRSVRNDWILWLNRRNPNCDNCWTMSYERPKSSTVWRRRNHGANNDVLLNQNTFNGKEYVPTVAAAKRIKPNVQELLERIWKLNLNGIFCSRSAEDWENSSRVTALGGNVHLATWCHRSRWKGHINKRICNLHKKSSKWTFHVDWTKKTLFVYVVHACVSSTDRSHLKILSSVWRGQSSGHSDRLSRFRDIPEQFDE